MCFHAPWRGRHRKRPVCVLWGTVCRNNSAIVSSYVHSSNIRENTNRLYTTRRSTSKLMEGPWELLSTSQWRCPIEGRYIDKGCSVVSELFGRNPESVIAKNFRASVLTFKDLPTDQLWIFPGTPAPKDIQEQNATGPAGFLPVNDSYSYHLSQQEPYEVLGVTSKSPTPPPSQSLRPSLPRLSPSNQVVREKYTGTPPPTNRLISLDGSGRLTVYQAPASRYHLLYRRRCRIRAHA